MCLSYDLLLVGILPVELEDTDWLSVVSCPLMSLISLTTYIRVTTVHTHVSTSSRTSTTTAGLLDITQELAPLCFL